MRKGYLIIAAVSALYLPMTGFASDGGGKENTMAPEKKEQPLTQQQQQLQQAVQGSQGLIVRVPVTTDGEELTQKAELRVHNSSVPASNIAAAWDTSFDTGATPDVGDNEDSIRNWIFGGGRHGGGHHGGYNYGYNNYGYNYGYYPSFTWGPSSYYYGAPSYYSYYPYSYYYYPRWYY